VTAPDYLVTPTFLGQPTGAGVNPDMAAVLATVENDLQAQYDGLPPDEQGATSFTAWCGLHDEIIGWRHNAGYHASGSAVDLNVTTCPYIATRTNGTPGGESGADPAALAAAVAVYDRAVSFMEGSDAPAADVRAKRGSENHGDVWDRFMRVSGALSYYLAFAVRSDLLRINRTPVPDAENASTDALDGIPTTERWDKDQALGYIDQILSDGDFVQTHPDWNQDTETTYYRILRDYELVRIPMEFGAPGPAPAHTRNPARGFLDLPRWVVVSLSDVGQLHWGAADFGPQSGDMQHFDLGRNAYPPA
jgi:hypothetical protein